eukprot:193426_1
MGKCGSKLQDEGDLLIDKANSNHSMIPKCLSPEISGNIVDKYDYLFHPSDIYCASNETCVVEQCVSLIRIRNLLRNHKSNVKTEQKQSFNEKQHINYNNIDLLNDFNHLLFTHSNDFEDIYDALIHQHNERMLCDIKQCLILKRNQRDRTIDNTQLYVNKYPTYVIQEQLMDKIHCHYFHSFDIGYKFTQSERQYLQIEKDEKCKDAEDIKMDYSYQIKQIHDLIQSKHELLQCVDGLERLKNKNSKFISANITEYSYGYRYFYWPFYKNNNNVYDKANYYKLAHQPEPNQGYLLGDWYIYKKYHNFKQELLYNEICRINKFQWNNLLEKAKTHTVTNKGREIKCERTKECCEFYELTYQQQIETHHLIAVMIYCNYDILQRKFTETFRRKDENESNEQMKKRHQEYYHLGRFLREIVECFGMHVDDDVDSIRSITLYHGVDKAFTFPSLDAYIKGPFSTTTDYSVAAVFAVCSQGSGMVLQLNMDIDHWLFRSDCDFSHRFRISCFDCHWISDFSNENEIFTVGGLNKFSFETIIEHSGYNYALWIRGLEQMTYCMSNGDHNYSQNIPKTRHEKQMVFRLICHELSKYYPTHKHAHKFEGLPIYFDEILHSHCLCIKNIRFSRAKDELTLYKYLFKYNTGWIRLELICTLFPNIDFIRYSAYGMETNFVKFMYQSIASFMEKKKKTHLRNIYVEEIDKKYLSAVKKCDKYYQDAFHKMGWHSTMLESSRFSDGILVDEDSEWTWHSAFTGGKYSEYKKFGCFHLKFSKDSQ